MRRSSAPSDNLGPQRERGSRQSWLVWRLSTASCCRAPPPLAHDEMMVSGRAYPSANVLIVDLPLKSNVFVAQFQEINVLNWL